MRGSVFLDTNTLVYALEVGGPEPAKTAAAQAVSGAPLRVWEIRTLTAGDRAANAYSGHALSASGNPAAVGAYGADSGQGAVYVFARNQGGADQWQQVRRIVVPNGQPGDHFGFASAFALRPSALLRLYACQSGWPFQHPRSCPNPRTSASRAPVSTSCRCRPASRSSSARRR